MSNNSGIRIHLMLNYKCRYWDFDPHHNIAYPQREQYRLGFDFSVVLVPFGLSSTWRTTFDPNNQEISVTSHLDAASIGQLDAGIVTVYCLFCKGNIIARTSKGIMYEIGVKGCSWIKQVDQWR